MKVAFARDLYYPMECALMLARETNREFGLEPEEGSCPVSCDYFLRRFLKGRNPDAAYRSLSESLASIQELSCWVWENLSTSMEKRKKYFSWQQEVEPIGMIVVYEQMRQERTENLYPQLALLLTSVLTPNPASGIEEHPERLPSDEHSLYRFLTELSIEPALRLFLIDYVCHRKEYRKEVLDILGEAETLFKQKEKLVAPLVSSTVALLEDKLGGEKGMEYLTAHYQMKPDFDLVARPSVMGFDRVSLTCTDSLEGKGPGQLSVGVLFELCRRLSEENRCDAASLARRLKVLADPKRLDILLALQQGPLIGQELAERVSLTPATVSHHMEALLHSGLVLMEKSGVRILYQFSPQGVKTLLEDLSRLFFLKEE